MKIKKNLTIFLGLLWMYSLQAKEISVVTWNIFGIPKPFAWNSQVKRAKMIGEEINKLPFDVVIFQEAFSGAMRKNIYKRIKSNYPYQTRNYIETRFPAILSSGVWIVSRLPMKVIDQMYFDSWAGADIFASKGVVLVQVEASPGVSLQISGTHLRAWSAEKNVRVRKEQVQQIKELLDKNYNGTPQIVTGDFNIDYYHPAEYSSMIDILDVINTELTGSKKYSIGDPQNHYTAKGDKLELLDYVFLRRDDEIKVQFHSKEIVTILGHKKSKTYNLSDHDAVWAKVSL